MKISDHGLKLLAKWEGDILHVYKDVAGYKTIGIGHLLTKSELSTGLIKIEGINVPYLNDITEKQSLDLLSQDVGESEDTVSKHVTLVLSQNQFDCLVSFTFNCGDAAFVGSTLLKILNQGKFDQIPDQLIKWDHAGGKVCDVLIGRRESEIKLWNGVI
jgi:lysozyme